ncbi:MAG TPA: endonuclease III, partial [Phenylobacterium sp.]|nr:endonuclease III [Phenylobacterium sp.]
MQPSLAFPSALSSVRDRLRAVFGALDQTPERRMDPVSQLIKAVIGSRTFDEVAWGAFFRLQRAYPDWRDLGRATADDIEPIIDPVAFADQKARQLPILIRLIILRRGELDLEFLADRPVDEAMSWLMQLNGVGVRAAAATLNFSRLNRRAMVVDPHVHRLARRLGLVGRAGDETGAYHALMAQAPADWQARDLFEFHWLLKPYGQSICTHFEPVCGLCA